MAVTITNALVNAAAVSTGTTTTASWTPDTTAQYLLAINTYVSTGTANPTTPTLSGNGLTWTLILGPINGDNTGADRTSLWVWAASGAGGTAGTLTITWGTTRPTQAAWVIDKVAGAHTGLATGKLNQAAVSGVSSGANPSATLLADGLGPGSVTWAVGGFESSTGTLSAGSGYTALATKATTSLAWIITEWNSSGSQTATASNSTTTNRHAIILLEILPAPAAGGASTLTVTATPSGAFANGAAIRVKVLTNVAATQNGATGSSITAEQASITTTTTGSRVYGAVLNGGSTAFTPNASSDMLDNVVDATAATVWGSCRAAAATGTPGATTIGSSTTFVDGGVALFEVKPNGTITEDTSGPLFAKTDAAGAVTSPSFNPPDSALLVVMASALSTGLAISDSLGTLTWTQKVLITNDGAVGVWIAFVPSGSTNATATPSVVAAPASVPAPSPNTGEKATPSVVGAVASIGTAVGIATAAPAVVSVAASIGSATLSTGEKVSPAVVPAVASIGAASLSTGEKTTPAVVAVVASVGSPSVNTGEKASPGVVPAPASIGAAAPNQGQVASPGVVPAVASIGAPTVQAGSVAHPSVVPAPATIGAPSVSTGTNATATPGVVASSASIGSPTVQVVAQPGVVACLASIGAPAPNTGETASPARVSAVATIGSPTVQAGAVAHPGVVPAPASVGSPALRTDEVATPAVVPVTATITTPSLGGGSTVPATVVACPASIGSPVLSTGEVASPGVVPVVASLGVASPNAGQTVTPTVVPAPASIGSPVVGAATTVTPAEVHSVATIGAPALWHRNNAEGGTDGATVTAGTSGGASGDAFDVVDVSVGGAGGVLAFDSTHSAHGGLSYKMATGGAAVSNYLQWSSGFGTTTWWRIYLYFTANPVNSHRVLEFGNAGAVSGVIIAASGKIVLVDSAGVTQVTSTSTIPLNQWFRLEGFTVQSATVGQVGFSLYNLMDSVVADETKTSAATLNTSASPITSARFGEGVFGVLNVGPFWMDDLGLSQFGPLGPVAEQVQIAPSVVQCAATIGGPKLWLRQDAEAGANGATVVASTSGSSTSDKWDSVQIPSGGSVTYDNSTAAHGSQSFKIVTGSPAGNGLLVWTTALTATSIPEVWLRGYYSLASVTTGNLRLMEARNGSGNCAIVQVNSAGKVQILDATATGRGLSTTVLTANQWFRLEAHVVSDAVAGSVEVKIFTSMDSVTPVETISATAINTGSSGINRADFGNPSSIATFTMWADDLAVSTFGYIGPAGQAAQVTPGTVNAVATIGVPVVGAATTVTPGVVACAASIGSPALRTDEMVSASVVQAVTVIPSPAIHAGSTASPTVVNVAATISTPTVSGAAKAQPSVVTVTATIGSPSLSAGSTASPPRVSATATITVPNLTTGSLVQAANVAVRVAIGHALVIAAKPYTPGPWTLGDIHTRWAIGDLTIRWTIDGGHGRWAVGEPATRYSAGEAHQRWRLGALKLG